MQSDVPDQIVQVRSLIRAFSPYALATYYVVHFRTFSSCEHNVPGNPPTSYILSFQTRLAPLKHSQQSFPVAPNRPKRYTTSGQMSALA